MYRLVVRDKKTRKVIRSVLCETLVELAVKSQEVIPEEDLRQDMLEAVWTVDDVLKVELPSSTASNQGKVE